MRFVDSIQTCCQKWSVLLITSTFSFFLKRNTVLRWSNRRNTVTVFFTVFRWLYQRSTVVFTKTKKNFNPRSKNKITVYVSLTKITGISLSGSCDIIGQGKFRNDGKTDFKLSGSGSIRMVFDKVQQAEVSIAGSGDIRLTGSANTVSARISAACQR